jgi:hypothetical protein
MAFEQEEQDWNIPGSLVSSIYAAFVNGLDYYEMYEEMWIPAKYTNAIRELWDSWELEKSTNPLPEGGSHYIPSEFPDID